MEDIRSAMCMGAIKLSTHQTFEDFPRFVLPVPGIRIAVSALKRLFFGTAPVEFDPIEFEVWVEGCSI